MSVRMQDLPLCCGVALISNFGGTDRTSGNFATLTLTQLKTELKRVEKACYSHSMMIATLTDEQYEAYFKTFKELGWSVVRKGINGLHNSTNYLLVKVLRKV